jgi:glycosyltransferase involved in cell wall biosynthesis
VCAFVNLRPPKVDGIRPLLSDQRRFRVGLAPGFGPGPCRSGYAANVGDHQHGRVTVPRIALVTNVAAPYRHPVWAAIAEGADLEVGLLADNEPNRQWSAELPDGVPRLKTKAYALHRGRLHMYVLSRPVLRGNFDVVILPGWELPASWQLLIEAKLRRVRTVAFYESSAGSHRFGSGPVAFMRARFFRWVDSVVTVGEASTAAVLGFGVRPERVISTENTVDVAAIHSHVRETSVEDRRERFVYLGQLIHRKNVDSLLDAFATLPATGRLLVAGEGPDEDALRSKAFGLGISDRVDFRGYVPYEQVPDLLAEASTLVLPSRTEVYGLVVVEALAAGLHVVLTENSGVYADVRDLTGVFGAKPTPGSLAAAMATSAEAWTGPVEQPTILARTPQAMAEDVLRACAIARQGTH